MLQVVQRRNRADDSLKGRMGRNVFDPFAVRINSAAVFQSLAILRSRANTRWRPPRCIEAFRL